MEVVGHRDDPVPLIVTRLEGTTGQLALVKQKLAHASQVEKAAANEGQDVAPQPFFPRDQEGLAGNEDQESEEEIASTEQELIGSDPVPQQICKGHHHAMAHQPWVLVVSQPLQGWAEVTFQVLHQMLDVVIHPTLAILHQPRPPNEPIEQGPQQC